MTTHTGQQPMKNQFGEGQPTDYPITDYPIEDRYNFHEASFRRHYQLNYRAGGRSFDDYAPAYQFGYELAVESPGMEWDRVIPAAERHWRANHGSDWPQMLDAIHYGWLEQRDPDSLRVHHDERYEDYRSGFLTHYEAEAGVEGDPFEIYEPAYRRGYALAIDPAYSTHQWADIEPEVRRYYESEYADGQLTWERYHNAAYHAWQRMRP